MDGNCFKDLISNGYAKGTNKYIYQFSLCF
jgi:hypothetical protein